MAATEAEAFQLHLVVDRNVAAATKNQALSAIIFLLDSAAFAKVGESELRKKPLNVRARNLICVHKGTPIPNNLSDAYELIRGYIK